MDTAAYISSGVIELYCLGLLSPSEALLVEEFGNQYPLIRLEITRINETLETYAGDNGVEPLSGTKIKLLLKIYEQESGTGKKYPPLINANTGADAFKKWISEKEIPSPGNEFENLSFHDLPSTDAVTNFMVWAKVGHDEEEHSEYNEYIVILDGHCDMYFNGEKKHYEAGQIITIPPYVPHHAVITSQRPMIALVQRQLIAA